MVHGRWWKVLGIFIVFAVILVILELVIVIPFWLLGLFAGEGAATIIIPVTQATIQSVIQSYFTVLAVIFYINFDANRLQKKETHAA